MEIKMRRTDSFVDLEYGKIVSDDEIKKLDCSSLHSKKTFDRTRSGVGGLNGFTKDGDWVSTSKGVLISRENDEILMGGVRGEAVSIMKKKNVNEKWKKLNFKKPPKPPRPHGIPSLDEADMKMVKEISELARLKHARKERIKALKKKRIHKASSSIGIYATIVTILFCLIIIYQGLETAELNPRIMSRITRHCLVISGCEAISTQGFAIHTDSM
ncbi:hypothetical protein QYF36_016682 [Acer negundo]|nr:hypothetical protein QYF36_016682 [Acer negundo]